MFGHSPGLCAGKRSVAKFLVDRFDFKEIILAGPGETRGLGFTDVHLFTDVHQLLAYVTPLWRKHFVLCDVRKKHVLDELSTRPFFILIGIDAPVTVRWERYMRR